LFENEARSPTNDGLASQHQRFLGQMLLNFSVFGLLGGEVIITLIVLFFIGVGHVNKFSLPLLLAPPREGDI